MTLHLPIDVISRGVPSRRRPLFHAGILRILAFLIRIPRFEWCSVNQVSWLQPSFVALYNFFSRRYISQEWSNTHAVATLVIATAWQCLHLTTLFHLRSLRSVWWLRIMSWQGRGSMWPWLIGRGIAPVARGTEWTGSKSELEPHKLFIYLTTLTADHP
jgi:hypothetical protein